MLTAHRVERTSTPGRYRDGEVKGLLLQISESGAKSWVLRYELNGRERMMGLGSAAIFNLKEARERARSARQLLVDGVDPLATKRAAKAAAKAAAEKALTFGEAAERYFNQHQAKWKNAKHRDQFLASLNTYASPIAEMDVAAITLADVLRCIEPHWNTKSITMDRVRNRIEAVLDWAVVRGHRPPGTNPARWKNHLDQVLATPRKIAPVRHHAAMAYDELPAFMQRLREQQGSAARALALLILTAGRMSEALGATWDEIDFKSAMWTVPPERMKTSKEHRVPLSPEVIKLLRDLPREDGNPYVFIGPKPGSGLSKMAVQHLIRRLIPDGSATTHGFRSSFSDWAHERTAYSSHTIEISLSHKVGSDVERAYRRGPMLAKRVKLMADWARFCSTPPTRAKGKDGNVVAIRARR